MRHKTKLKTSDITCLTLFNISSKHLASARWFTGCLRTTALCFCTFIRKPTHTKWHKSLNTGSVSSTRYLVQICSIDSCLISPEYIKVTVRRFLLSGKMSSYSVGRQVKLWASNTWLLPVWKSAMGTRWWKNLIHTLCYLCWRLATRKVKCSTLSLCPCYKTQLTPLIRFLNGKYKASLWKQKWNQEFTQVI